jgi:hypothetical protein
MAERRIINGYIVERGDDGQLRTIGPANGPAPQMPADPTFQYEGPQASATLTKTQLDNKVTEATLPYALRKAAADAAAAEAAAAKAGQAGPESETQLKAGATAGDLRTMMQTINELQTLYNQNLAGQGPLQSIGEYFPSNANDRINTLSAGLGQLGMSAFRVPGSGEQSDRELANFIDANQPSTWNRDSGFIGKLDNLRRRAENRLQELGQPAPEWVLPTDQIQEQEQQQDNDMAVAGNPQGPDQADRSNVYLGDAPEPDRGGYAPYGAEYRTVDNPALAGVNAAIGKMIAQGASREQIAAFAASKGVTLPPDTKWGQETPAGRAWLKQNPGKPYPVNVDDMVVPMSGFEQFRNNAPQTKVGTALATMGNAGGFGIPQALAGSDSFDYLRSQEPEAAFAGDVAGAIGGTAMLGRAGGTLAGKFAPSLLGGGTKAAAGRQLATDAAYGGIYGGTTEGTPQGVLTGALTAGGGSALGMGAGQVIKSAIAPTGGRLAGVMADGARPTLGQRMVNSGGPIGQFINGTEEIFKSYPGLGAAIDVSREAGRKSWQGAGFKRALDAIGEKLPDGVQSGPEAFKYTRKAFDDTYDKARSGMQFVPDQGYQQEFGQWQQNWINGGLLDSEGINQVTNAISTRVGSRMRNGVLTGDTYKKAISDLNSTINNVGKPEVKKALAEYRSVLDSAARRNSDPAAVELMDKADFGYSQFKPLKDAARRAGSEPGYFTPQGLASVNRQQMGKTNAFIEGDTRLGEYIKQGDNFRDRVPNSGTPERLLTIQGIASPAVGAAGFFSPATLAAAAATLPYMPVVEKGAKALIAPRGGKAKKIGGMFGTRAAQKALGSAGAGVGIGALPFYD